jgi:hypothetical protein
MPNQQYLRLTHKPYFEGYMPDKMLEILVSQIFQHSHKNYSQHEKEHRKEAENQQKDRGNAQSHRNGSG